MADEATLRKWAFDHTMKAAKAIYSDDAYTARRELSDAAMWLEQADEARAKREKKEAADKTAAAYTDLADVA